MAEEKTKEEFIKCPCCGELTLRKPLDIKSIVLDEYMASIVTGVPFAHTYTVHDSIDITAEIPAKKDAQLMLSTVQKLSNLASSAENKEEAELNDKIRSAGGMIQLYGAVTSIVTRRDKVIVKTYTPSEVIKDFCNVLKDLNNDKTLIVEAFEERNTPELLSAVPDLMLRAIVKTHNDIYTILLDTGFNENFWKGIELV